MFEVVIYPGTVKVGDFFTIAHVHKTILNHNRKWWQIWKPRKIVDHSKTQSFKVVSIV
jgi:hypothetical protein